MMNGQRYRRLLDEKLELFMHQHETNHFLQDGALCHKAKIVTQWFKERPNIKLIKWPGNSPDLNPIENVWAWMKLQLKETSCTNMKELKEEIVKLWVTRVSDSDYLKKLVESMPKRLAEVIEKDGATTGY
jgi:transposase